MAGNAGQIVDRIEIGRRKGPRSPAIDHVAAVPERHKAFPLKTCNSGHFVFEGGTDFISETDLLMLSIEDGIRSFHSPLGLDL